MNTIPAPRLPGSAPSDYERYLRTDELLRLQKSPEEMAHRDELLFQTAHQSAELWLKHAAWEIEGAGSLMETGNHGEAARLLENANNSLACVGTCTQKLSQLSPSDYHAIRPMLGNGSGFDSPGFRMIYQATARLNGILMATLDKRSIGVGDVAADRQEHPEFHAIIERMLDIDQRMAEWRHGHFLIIQRLLGSDSVGLQGYPIQELLGRMERRLFPALWLNRGRTGTGQS